MQLSIVVPNRDIKNRYDAMLRSLATCTYQDLDDYAWREAMVESTTVTINTAYKKPSALLKARTQQELDRIKAVIADLEYCSATNNAEYELRLQFAQLVHYQVDESLPLTVVHEYGICCDCTDSTTVECDCECHKTHQENGDNENGEKWENGRE